MNPLLPMSGVCDPHMHVFDGKVYMYATCDNLIPGAKHFQMTKWQVWSSEDLVHWNLESTMYPKDMCCGEMDQCWAVDAAEKDGKYYWYYSIGSQAVGVGVADNPGGPFVEALGHPLVDAQTPPVGMRKWDPCVFVDDDGSAYLIAGSTLRGDEYQIAKLNPDMLSLAEPLRTIVIQGNPLLEDKATIHKENGIYYFTHSSFYATSDNVYGPYVFRGNTRANNDHGSFFTYRGQTYQATGGMDNPNRRYRTAYLSYCHYRANGEIAVEQLPTCYGVGQYDASWQRIEAEWFSACENMRKLERQDGGFEMRAEAFGGWLEFPNVCHLADGMELSVSYSNPGAEAQMEILEGGVSGKRIGLVTLKAATKNTVAGCRLANEAGHKTLCFRILGEGVCLDWFCLGGETHRQAVEAFRGYVLGNAKTTACPGAAADQALCLTQPGDGMTFVLDGCGGGEMRCILRYQAQSPAVLGWNDGMKLTLPATGDSIGEYTFLRSPEPGVNRCSLVLEAGESLLLDSLRTESAPSKYRSYPAADGRIVPYGNGCWVSHFDRPGFRITLDQVDGGEIGEEVGLNVSYKNEGDAPLYCRIELNGGDGGILEFPSTGENMGVTCAKIQLHSGRNTVALTMMSNTDAWMCVDAVSVVPATAIK